LAWAEIYGTLGRIIYSPAPKSYSLARRRKGLELAAQAGGRKGKLLHFPNHWL